jgi:hypothetical protein
MTDESPSQFDAFLMAAVSLNRLIFEALLINGTIDPARWRARCVSWKRSYRNSVPIPRRTSEHFSSGRFIAAYSAKKIARFPPFALDTSLNCGVDIVADTWILLGVFEGV